LWPYGILGGIKATGLFEDRSSLWKKSPKEGREMSIQQPGRNIINDAIIKDISESIHGLNFGTVMITVHNSKIVQIEISKKSRFDDIWMVQEGEGI
jgi:hypothetical protein